MALSTAKRNSLPNSAFKGPGRTFPIINPREARAALSGATRSYNVGNISKTRENEIKHDAKSLLDKKGK